MPIPSRSAVLTLRVPAALERRVARVARQRKTTKSAVLRKAIERAFGGRRPDPREVRRQSLLVSATPDEQDVLEFITATSDDRGWR